jgi:hypothetical protein
MNFHDAADEIAAIERRVSDAIYESLRAQVRDEGADEAAALEKRLSKVRRALQKAEGLLRGTESD